jgi:hypothetical protein
MATPCMKIEGEGWQLFEGREKIDANEGQAGKRRGLSNLKGHLQTNTGGTPFLCSQCQKSTLSNALKHHLQTLKPEQYFKSLQCPQSFACLIVFKCHQQTHTGG